MDPSDVEMEAAEVEPTPQQPPPPPAVAAAGEEGWSLLSRARVLLEEGKPSLALQAILLAIRSQGGELALMQTLNRARELYRQRSQPSSPSVDDLASLLAQCAIAESQSTNTNPQHAPGSDPVMMLDSDEACILSESGRKQIILDAFADGSSFICLKCGGLFSTSRKDEHLAYWCGTA
uniref:C2HC zinc finger plants domain-containing protein n=1 Tax=Leersia perrieri TaxID=77586 RepID=A0A0D9VCE9_9ORYZ